MSAVRPFAALRPRPQFAARIAAVPYDVVNTAEARRLAQDPLSFLHVSRAEIDLPDGTNPYDDRVYARAAENLSGLRASSMVQEDRPSIYAYRLQMGDHVQTGVAATFSLDEYRGDLIKKHEKTRPDKENDRTRHIVETRAQSGPVLLTYRRAPAVDAAVKRVASGSPLYDFEAPDGIRHTIWRADDETAPAIVSAFAEVPALYIADGHHRAASAARATPGPGWFLAVAFPDAETRILPYHRVVLDLGGRTAESFLSDVRTRLPLTAGTATPRRRGECSMYLAGTWHTLGLDGNGPASDPAADLDVSRLHERLLAPLLGIVDQRTDKRIDFVGGIRGTGELERLVDDGRAAVAFSMYPTTVADLMAISDVGGIMPPKSTWFEPKLRDGLLTHLL
jgi:uncharacterized protein (DUF1015 family)